MRLIPFILARLLGAAQAAGAQHPGTAALQRELRRLMEIGDVPGLSVAVLDGGTDRRDREDTEDSTDRQILMMSEWMREIT